MDRLTFFCIHTEIRHKWVCYDIIYVLLELSNAPHRERLQPIFKINLDGHDLIVRQLFHRISTKLTRQKNFLVHTQETKVKWMPFEQYFFALYHIWSVANIFRCVNVHKVMFQLCQECQFYIHFFGVHIPISGHQHIYQATPTNDLSIQYKTLNVISM